MPRISTSKTQTPSNKKGQALIFLDFDGVLNSDAYFAKHPEAKGNSNLDPKAITRLCRFIDKERCQVVVSSTWRVNRNVSELRAILFERGFVCPEAIIGRTAKLSSGGRDAPRGHEISKFLRDYPSSPFVILDDDDDMHPVQDHLVQTDPRVGLVDADLRKASLVLRYQRSP